MKNDRFYGIKFKGGSNCGIAKITVVDITTGKYIAADGSESDTIVSRLLDTFRWSNDSETELTFVYWISLTVGHEYTISVENSGTHHDNAVAPYNIVIVDYIDINPVNDAQVEQQVFLWHTDHPNEIYTKTITAENSLQDLTVVKEFVGDGVTTLFELGEADHAYEFVKCTPDNWVTVIYPSDYVITWGSDSEEDYADEIIDSNGFFAVKFNEAPIVDAVIKIEFIPKINRYKVKSTLIQPQLEEEGWVDYKSAPKVTDYAIEFLK